MMRVLSSLGTSSILFFNLRASLFSNHDKTYHHTRECVGNVLFSWKVNTTKMYLVTSPQYLWFQHHIYYFHILLFLKGTRNQVAGSLDR